MTSRPPRNDGFCPGSQCICMRHFTHSHFGLSQPPKTCENLVSPTTRRVDPMGERRAWKGKRSVENGWLWPAHGDVVFFCDVVGVFHVDEKCEILVA